jgi:hypothetical protein
MIDAAQKAIDVLTEIAEDEKVESDTRVRAACSILDHIARVSALSAPPR